MGDDGGLGCGTAHRRRLRSDHGPERHHGSFRDATPDVDHHRPESLLHRQARSDRRCHRRLQRRELRLRQRPLHALQYCPTVQPFGSERNSDHHVDLASGPGNSCMAKQPLEQHLSHVDIGDDAPLDGFDDLHPSGVTTDHVASLIANGENPAIALTNDCRRFLDQDPTGDADPDGGRTEVDREAAAACASSRPEGAAGGRGRGSRVCGKVHRQQVVSGCIRSSVVSEGSRPVGKSWSATSRRAQWAEGTLCARRFLERDTSTVPVEGQLVGARSVVGAGDAGPGPRDCLEPLEGDGAAAADARAVASVIHVLEGAVRLLDRRIGLLGGASRCLPFDAVHGGVGCERTEELLIALEPLALLVEEHFELALQLNELLGGQ